VSDDWDMGTATTIQTCNLKGTTRAICSTTEITQGAGKNLDSTTIGTLTLSGTDVVFASVPVFSGERLSHLAACTTSSGIAAVATGTVRELCKVMVVPGAAAVLVGAFA
jgi:hypothetical protein